MHIKERGVQIYFSLYVILLLCIIATPSESIIERPEVVMVPAYQQMQLTQPHIPVIEVEEPEPVVELKPRYGFTEKEIYLLTVLLCGSGKRDGDGEYDFDFQKEPNKQQISLVLNVVMNRVESKKFPNKVKDVVWAKGQFVYMPHWKNGLPKVKPESYEVVKAWCEAYDTHDYRAVTIPPSHLYFS